MVMPTDGNNKESIFPASEWDYNDRASFCKAYFNVEPRPTWITTEFGGHVTIYFLSLTLTLLAYILSIFIDRKKKRIHFLYTVYNEKSIEL